MDSYGPDVNVQALFDLAREDPVAFERRVQQLKKEQISAAPAEMRGALESIQNAVDSHVDFDDRWQFLNQWLAQKLKRGISMREALNDRLRENRELVAVSVEDIRAMLEYLAERLGRMSSERQPAKECGN